MNIYEYRDIRRDNRWENIKIFSKECFGFCKKCSFLYTDRKCRLEKKKFFFSEYRTASFLPVQSAAGERLHPFWELLNVKTMEKKLIEIE